MMTRGVAVPLPATTHDTPTAEAAPHDEGGSTGDTSGHVPPALVKMPPSSSPPNLGAATTEGVGDRRASPRDRGAGAGATDDSSVCADENDSDEVDSDDANAGATAAAQSEEWCEIEMNRGIRLVAKSIFKEKKGFLTRLRDASSLRKYAPGGDGSSQVVLPTATASNTMVVPTSRVDATKPSIGVVLDDDEDPIDLAITPTLATATTDELSPLPLEQEGKNADVDGHDEFAGAPQVVIHSGESDSDSTGYATLNPVINRSQRSGRGSCSTGGGKSTGGGVNMSGSGGVAMTEIGNSPPLLVELPTVHESSADSNDRLTLIINALGSTGLSKVEKFGTQSTRLEMYVGDAPRGGSGHVNPPAALSYSVLRTRLHKKGGSEAQWNQQFSTPLRSATEQVLFAAVRTDNKALVGEAVISLADVGEDVYDQHYTIYRIPTTTINDQDDSSSQREVTGQIHLQLKIIDAAAAARLLTPVGVSPPPLTLSPGAQIQPALKNGALMFKVAYHSHALMTNSGAARRQWIAVCDDADTQSQSPPPEHPTDTLCITWCDAVDVNAAKRRLKLSQVTEIREGARTKAFARLLLSDSTSVARESERCFSLITNTRTLDLVAASKDECFVWVRGLQQLLFRSTIGADCNTQAINDYRQSALSPRNSPSPSISKKSRMAYWRSVIFSHARDHRLEDISVFLQDGCPIDLLETGTGDTLLMFACRVGDVKLVELCLSWRAKNDPHPEFGETALQVAVNSGYSDCLKLLLTTAAKSEMDSEIVNHIDSQNDAPLHVAARRGDLACLQLLLHHGADICVVEEFGRTPLHCAVSSGNLDCVAYLLDVGGDSVLNAGDHDGDTALHYGALAGNESVVKLLLESAADASSVNIHNETPYDLAVREGHEGCVALIGEYYQPSDAVQTTPATCNETASALLHQQHPQYKTVREYDGGMTSTGQEEEEEEYEGDGYLGFDAREVVEYEDYVEPSDSPVRRGPISPYPFAASEYEDRDIRSPQNDSQRRYVAATSVPSRHPISPSARIREVLATHRQHLSHAAVSRIPYERGGPRSFYSAREDTRSCYSAFEPPPYRQAFTERVMGEEYRPATSYIDRRAELEEARRHYRGGYRGNGNSYDRPYALYHDSGYDSDPMTTRSRGQRAPEFRTRGFGDYPGNDYPYNQLSNNYAWHLDASYGQQRVRCSSDIDLSYQPSHSDWPHHPHRQHRQEIPPAYIQPSPPLPCPPQAAVSDEWDTFVSEEGYTYYVNQQTGVSQWENPNEVPTTPILPPTPAPAVTPHPSVTLINRSLPADTAIRMRLAEARQPKSDRNICQEQMRASSDEMQGDRQNALDSVTTAATSGNIDGNSANDTNIKPDDARTPEGRQQSVSGSPPGSPVVSKYESRTGQSLSVDIASPIQQDETRPVFVPSPRSKSPKKGNDTSGNVNGSPNASFTKTSRQSSPRGKTKRVQLLELKRANNLALALANFKLNDRYEHVINGLVALDEKVISVEMLMCLQRFFPSDEEAVLLRDYNGPMLNLGKAERFLVQLLRVPDIQQRIDMFLYKLGFQRNHRRLQTKIQLVKRACRDLVENFSFVEALDKFFALEKTTKSFRVFQEKVNAFRSNCIDRTDEKLLSFRDDLEKAAEIEFLDLQMQFNRLTTGSRAIQTFVDRHNTSGQPDIPARDVLQRFLVENRALLSELENDYEAMSQWETKMLGLFGESKASCQLTTIFSSLCDVLAP